MTYVTALQLATQYVPDESCHKAVLFIFPIGKDDEVKDLVNEINSFYKERLVEELLLDYKFVTLLDAMGDGREFFENLYALNDELDETYGSCEIILSADIISIPCYGAEED